MLGPVAVSADGVDLDLGTPRQRTLVAALALSGGRPVGVDTIVDLVWGDAPPAGVATTLQAYVSGLRKVLEPGRARRAPAEVLVTVAPGYALHVSEEDVDAHAFEREVADANRLLESALPTRAALEEVDAMLGTALARWRGRPYAELGDAPAAVAERARLEELRLVALEDRAVAALALGRHATAAAELEALTTAHPLRERLWALRALALARSGRQAEALEVLRRVRSVLDDELGIEPGAELRNLQTALLRQDSALDWNPPPEPADEGSPASAPWPMVGRDQQLAALARSLDAALAGTTSFAAITGEPGIGKSRLATELGLRAAAAGAVVAVGRCSSDEGAPPLWPWRSVLEELGLDFPDVTDAADDFRVREAILASVREQARGHAVVVVLEDLHWADPASLRCLMLLAESVTDARLLVVATWRDHPEPSGLFADAAEALARRHAVRLHLSGLGPDEVAEVVVGVADSAPSPAQVEALHERTDGNPFFLVEYARLAGERGDLAALLAEDDTPRAVQDVLTRRLARLPEDTRAALATAAVVGRQFDGPTLRAVLGTDDEGVLDLLEPAVEAGLVGEEGIDRYSFAHALVRDSLYAGLSASRRARRHAIVAAAIAGADRPSEEARHWLAAGPAHAATAWRAAERAAEAARALHAHEDRAELLTAALGAMSADPGATTRDRFDALMELADAHRWSARWTELAADVAEAIGEARSLGDPELLARAALATTQGALWQSSHHGQVNEDVVAALREALADLPPDPSALRCRVMAALASEQYYTAPFAERADLVARARAMADDLGDPGLVVDVAQVGVAALWTAGTALERAAWAEESARLARDLGRDRDVVISTTLQAVALGEAGRPLQMREVIAPARVEADRLRLAYAQLVLDGLEIPWLAMAGEFEACAAALERMRRLERTVTLPQSDVAILGAELVLTVWSGHAEDVVDLLVAMEETDPLPLTSVTAALLCRAGRVDDARDHLRRYTVDLDHDDWFSMLAWCNAAEAALYVGDRTLAADALARIAPFPGFSCSAGSGNASGPVDHYIACAHAALGDLAAARAHADRAEELCEQWQIPLAAQRLRDQRDHFGY
ncbi:Transcriptional regulatory protein, C terminal [Aeromicrobium choanae]|uniref:Transcriptional regulatory protein, C terminal n=1 Tax=Aeromicrobium choanae TaxID=1736691 RepID=A0A1T4Z0M7_9ACTN|nr:Transcriptional regulatory protein, C terminal [Aeromicrobium choanae]